MDKEVPLTSVQRENSGSQLKLGVFVQERAAPRNGPITQAGGLPSVLSGSRWASSPQPAPLATALTPQALWLWKENKKKRPEKLREIFGVSYHPQWRQRVSRTSGGTVRTNDPLDEKLCSVGPKWVYIVARQKALKIGNVKPFSIVIQHYVPYAHGTEVLACGGSDSLGFDFLQGSGSG